MEDIEKARILDKAEAIEVMIGSKGWSVFVDEAKGRYSRFLKELMTCKEEELKSLQAKIREIELILEIPKDILKEKKELGEE